LESRDEPSETWNYQMIEREDSASKGERVDLSKCQSWNPAVSTSIICILEFEKTQVQTSHETITD
jgi:hypothetical protein